MKQSNTKIKPDYYELPGGGDVITEIKRLFGIEAAKSFCVGNVLKYIKRYPKKNGIEDLNKAQSYLSRLVEMESKEQR